ncbi:MAG: hypothetical protein HYU63_09520 [Armatimonadetes bacterium]|nr:hypothetical protein [Armatimonadota bacterium]
MKAYLKIILLIFFVIFFSSPLNEVFAHNSKKILVLYKERDPSHEGVVNYLTTFLKESGYTWEAKDIEKLLPERDKLDLSSFQGILTCYLSSEMVGGDIYPLWLVSQMEKGKKIVIVGSYGAYQALIPKPNGKFISWNESTQTMNTFFWPFGLEFYFGWTNDPQKLKITKKEKEFSEFQANLPDKLNYYQLYKSINKNNKVYLEVNRLDMLEAKSALIAHTPFGGMILEGFGFFWDDKEKKIIQRVNFKKFFEIAFSGDAPKVPVYNVKNHDQLLGENPLPEVFPPNWEWLADKDEVKRKILVLYKKNEAKTVEDHPLYHRGEIALNYLGAILDYYPIESGLPDEKMMQNYKGIITWNTTPFMFNADEYGRWLYNQINLGRKLVIIQDYGAFYDLPTQIESGTAEKVFSALGIEYKKLPPSRIEYLPVLQNLDKAMLGFEAYFDPNSIYYSSKFTSKLKENKVFLSFKDYYAGDIDLVVITPKGAIAMENSAFYFPPGDPERIALIRKALKKEIKPELA